MLQQVNVKLGKRTFLLRIPDQDGNVSGSVSITVNGKESYSTNYKIFTVVCSL